MNIFSASFSRSIKEVKSNQQLFEIKQHDRVLDKISLKSRKNLWNLQIERIRDRKKCFSAIFSRTSVETHTLPSHLHQSSWTKPNCANSEHFRTPTKTFTGCKFKNRHSYDGNQSGTSRYNYLTFHFWMYSTQKWCGWFSQESWHDALTRFIETWFSGMSEIQQFYVNCLFNAIETFLNLISIS